MNTKKVVVIAVVTVLALLAIGGGIVFAQSNQPGWGWGMGGFGGGMMGGYGYQNGTPAPGYGYGMMGGFGPDGSNYASLRVNTMHQWMFTTGGMRPVVWNGLAEALNLTPDELYTQLASGQTLAQIAEAQGVSQEQLASALETSVKAGLDKAVADGVLTQEQADWMLNHMSGNYGWMVSHMGTGAGVGFGPGGCPAGVVPAG